MVKLFYLSTKFERLSHPEKLSHPGMRPSSIDGGKREAGSFPCDCFVFFSMLPFALSILMYMMMWLNNFLENYTGFWGFWGKHQNCDRLAEAFCLAVREIKTK
jgi:hypothetical protein